MNSWNWIIKSGLIVVSILIVSSSSFASMKGPAFNSNIRFSTSLTYFKSSLYPTNGTWNDRFEALKSFLSFHSPKIADMKFQLTLPITRINLSDSDTDSPYSISESEFTFGNMTIGVEFDLDTEGKHLFGVGVSFPTATASNRTTLLLARISDPTTYYMFLPSSLGFILSAAHSTGTVNSFEVKLSEAVGFVKGSGNRKNYKEVFLNYGFEVVYGYRSWEFATELQGHVNSGGQQGNGNNKSDHSIQLAIAKYFGKVQAEFFSTFPLDESQRKVITLTTGISLQIEL